jgi:hypothetical protein
MNISAHKLIVICFITGLAACDSSGDDGSAVNTVSLAATGQNISYASGDDGDLQSGKTWPVARFTIGVGEVTDTLTGLMWVQDGSMPMVGTCGGGAVVSWQGALDYVSCLNAENYLGFSDWRLANKNELRSLVHYGEIDSSAWLNLQGFFGVQGDVSKRFSYWTSESRIDNPASAMIIGMGTASGLVNSGFKASAQVFAWPVRKNSSLPRTGQTSCFDQAGTSINCAGTGQDGDTQAGVSWPTPRFVPGTAAQVECVTDRLTGLVWQKSHDAVTRTWDDALNHVQGLTQCGYSDWRLPNINEMASLSHTGETNPAAWLMAQGFGTVSNGDFWSSTSYAGDSTNAWVTGLHGNADSEAKASASTLTWAVRGGQ